MEYYDVLFAKALSGGSGGGGGNELLKTVIEIKNSRNSTYTLTWPVTFNGYCIEENNQLLTEYDSENSIFIYDYSNYTPLTVEPGNTLIINCYYLTRPDEAAFSGIYTTLDSSDASDYVLTNVQFIAEYKVFAVIDVTESSKIYRELT